MTQEYREYWIGLFEVTERGIREAVYPGYGRIRVLCEPGEGMVVRPVEFAENRGDTAWIIGIGLFERAEGGDAVINGPMERVYALKQGERLAVLEGQCWPGRRMESNEQDEESDPQRP